LDFLSGIDASYKDVLLTPTGMLNPKYEHRHELIRQTNLNTEYLRFNLALSDEHPLANASIRQPINTSSDREATMKYLRNSIGTRAEYGFIPVALRNDDDPVYGFEYRPEEARKLLESSGYFEMGAPEITLTTNSSYIDLCEYIQGQLKQIGL